MSELIKRQDAINAVAQLYKYESDRMTALQEIPVVTETEIRNKAIDEFVDKFLNWKPKDEEYKSISEVCYEIAEQMKGE